MKSFLSKSLSFIKSNLYLDRLSIIFLSATVLANIFIWIIWQKNLVNMTTNYLYLSTGVLIFNTAVAAIFNRKEPFLANISLAIALLIQLFIILYLKYFLIIFS